jgi:hypothetical protein
VKRAYVPDEMRKIPSNGAVRRQNRNLQSLLASHERDRMEISRPVDFVTLG